MFSESTSGALPSSTELVNLDEEIKVSNFDFIFISQASRIKKYIDALSYLVESMTPYQAVGFGFSSVVLENNCARPHRSFLRSGTGWSHSSIPGEFLIAR